MTQAILMKNIIQEEEKWEEIPLNFVPCVSKCLDEITRLTKARLCFCAVRLAEMRTAASMPFANHVTMKCRSKTIQRERKLKVAEELADRLNDWIE